MKSIKQALEHGIQVVFGQQANVELTRPDPKFGDWSTNVALQLAPTLGLPPRNVAQQIIEELQKSNNEHIQNIAIAGPGFINITLSDNALVQALNIKPAQTAKGQEVLVEFGDPNPFKAMHMGHLYAAIAGDTIARLVECNGAVVRRLSYHGDVGMHVARAMWALLQQKDLDIADALSTETKIGAFYAKGARAYKNDPIAKEQIEQINRQVYELRLSDDVAKNTTIDERFKQLYTVGFDRSFAAFDNVFAQLGIKFTKRYLESQSASTGVNYVRQHIGKVFEESEGAVVYRGEKAGLHTRVFINSRGLPTYEAKDLGLTELKNKDFPQAAQSIIITANEQTEYFKVMLAALGEFDPSTANKTLHIAHGFLSMTSGKMSSRQGISEDQTAANVLTAVRTAVEQQFSDAKPDIQQAVALAAVKYTFLKARIGNDIVFNVQESVALEGNSGPYLQYAHARARSILQKCKLVKDVSNTAMEQFQPGERILARTLTEYPEVIHRATSELRPHYICTYLYELAQVFNRFYEQNRVVGDSRQGIRQQLVLKYATVLQDGLTVLGIESPEAI